MLEASCRRIMLATVLVALTVGAALGEGRLQGRVTDTEGEGIPGVEIRLVPISRPDLPTEEVSTDKRGRFIFGIVRKATYRVAAMKEGWRVVYLEGNIAIPTDESFWSYDGEVGPGVMPPELSITGVSTVDYDMQMAEDAGGPGEWGTGVPLADLDEVVAQIQSGEAARALDELDRHVLARPDSANLHYLRGFALLAIDEVDQARKAAARAIELDAGFEGGHLLLGRALEKLGDAKQAAEEYRAEATTAENAGVRRDAWMALAVLSIESGESEVAVEALEHVIAEDPENVMALRELGNLYLQTGEKEKAAEILEQVASLGGADDPAVLYNLGADHYNKKEYAEAAELFSRAVEAKPDFAEAHMLLGNSRLNLGDIPGALESFKRFLELAPDAPQAADVRSMVDALGG